MIELDSRYRSIPHSFSSYCSCDENYSSSSRAHAGERLLPKAGKQARQTTGIRKKGVEKIDSSDPIQDRTLPSSFELITNFPCFYAIQMATFFSYCILLRHELWYRLGSYVQSAEFRTTLPYSAQRQSSSISYKSPYILTIFEAHF